MRLETYQQAVSALSPQHWQGELDCIIGPFDTRAQAQVYVAQRVNFQPGDVLETIFPRGKLWFVELKRLRL